jgi:hypothetical protein
MRGVRAWLTLPALLVGMSLFSGCVHAISVEVTYSPALYRLSQADQLKGIVLGVAKFEDRRGLTDRSNPQSFSYVGQRLDYRVGMTYKGQPLVPVADLVQMLFLEEFTRAGVDVKRIPKVLTKDDVAALREAGQQAAAAYVLGGRVLVFETGFELDSGGAYNATNRGSITLEITLVRVQGGDIVFENIVSASDVHEAPVSWPRNVERLMNTVFRRVVTRVVQQVAGKLALGPRDVVPIIAAAR